MDRLFYIRPNSLETNAVLQARDFIELDNFLEEDEDRMILNMEFSPTRDLAIIWVTDDSDRFEQFHRKYND